MGVDLPGIIASDPPSATCPLMDTAPCVANVAKCATLSRVVVCALAWAVSYDPEDFDSSSSIVAQGNSTMDAKVNSALHMFTHWDSVFFLEIAQHGYRFDQFFAFLPGYPLAIRALASFAPIELSKRNALVLSGFLVSNVSFVIAAVLLFRLGEGVLRDRKLAFRAAILFCITPASVFCSSIYTESIFTAASFSGFLLLEKQNHWTAAVMFAMCTAVRMNGITYIGFIWLRAAQGTLALARQFRRSRLVGVSISIIVLNGSAMLQCILVMSPFLLHLWNGYRQHCASVSNDLRPKWCESEYPNIYAHVQKSFWNIGFLHYFTANQLPNFALAAPILVLSVAAAWGYAKLDRVRFISGGLVSSAVVPKTGFGATSCAPYVCHWFGLMMITLPSMHVQVMTRMLVPCPPLYWYAATLFEHKTWHRSAVLVYFLGYTAAGCLLHSNFLPWT